jgi:hypothetical protein
MIPKMVLQMMLVFSHKDTLWTEKQLFRLDVT